MQLRLLLLSLLRAWHELLSRMVLPVHWRVLRMKQLLVLELTLIVGVSLVRRRLHLRLLVYHVCLVVDGLLGLVRRLALREGATRLISSHRALVRGLRGLEPLELLLSAFSRLHLVLGLVLRRLVHVRVRLLLGIRVGLLGHWVLLVIRFCHS